MLSFNGEDEKVHNGVCTVAASGSHTKCFTSPDGLRWVDACYILPPECFSSGVDYDVMGKAGKLAVKQKTVTHQTGSVTWLRTKTWPKA